VTHNGFLNRQGAKDAKNNNGGFFVKTTTAVPVSVSVFLGDLGVLAVQNRCCCFSLRLLRRLAVWF